MFLREDPGDDRPRTPFPDLMPGGACLPFGTCGPWTPAGGRRRIGVGVDPRNGDTEGESIMQFTDTASAGNGGVATSAANGGVVSIGNVNSGGNAGNAIGIGDTWGGNVGADGGTMTNSTQLDISANGGTAIADASGGDYNLAFVS
jgi:hypothetical protein